MHELFIFSLSNIGPMILHTRIACLNSNKGHAKKLHELQGVFRTPVSVILAVYISTPHRRKTRVLDKKFHWILIFETSCNTGFLLSSPQKRLCGINFIWAWF